MYSQNRQNQSDVHFQANQDVSATTAKKKLKMDKSASKDFAEITQEMQLGQVNVCFVLKGNTWKARGSRQNTYKVMVNADTHFAMSYFSLQDLKTAINYIKNSPRIRSNASSTKYEPLQLQSMVQNPEILRPKSTILK